MSVLWFALVGYAIGSLPIGYFIVRRSASVDLQREGSGNVGATNAYRTSGLALGRVVMAVDVAKGGTSVLLAGAGAEGVVAGAAAVVGHIFPVWLRFRGGKGVATAAGVFAVLAPWSALVAIAAFAMVVARTRFVSLGSVVAALVLPTAAWWLPNPRRVAVGATAVAALIVFQHRGNLARLWSHRERALER